MSFVICLTMALPVDAASNYFTGSTSTMNSLFGNPSASWNISSGSVPGNASVSSVKVNVNVSPGSDSFYLYVKHPSGYSATRLVGSTSLSFTEFNVFSERSLPSSRNEMSRWAMNFGWR